MPRDQTPKQLLQRKPQAADLPAQRCKIFTQFVVAVLQRFTMPFFCSNDLDLCSASLAEPHTSAAV